MEKGTFFENNGTGTTLSSPPDFVRGHPIHNLALEILGEIFIRCLLDPPNLTSFDDAPLLFLRVCRHWRQTALWTPRLWTELKLTQKLVIPPAKVFQMWLDNSGSLPLKVSLPGHAKYPKETREVIELLLDNFHRISELDGSLTPSFASILLKHSLPIRAPFLKRLDVGCWDKLPSLSDLERLRGSMIAPQLEVCSLNGLRFQLSLLSFDPARLRELYGLWVIEVAEFESMEFLISSTSLHTLTVFLQPALDASLLKIPPIIPIPSLRRLEITTYPDYDPNVFLKALDVAFIEHLELSSVHEYENGPLVPLLDALTGGIIPPLKSLTLMGYNVTASECISWIRMFTLLEKLTFGHGTLDLEALNSLTNDSSRSPEFWICPHLSTLHFKRVDFPWKAMEDLVRSRAPTRDVGGRLRKVTFEAPDNPEESRRVAFTKIQEDSRGLIQIEFLPYQHIYW